MRAMVIDRFGGPEEFHLAEVPTPSQDPGQVVIRLAFAGVSPTDWKCPEGRFAPYHAYTFPFIVGLDGAGVISAIAPDVTTFKLGDRVATKANQVDQWGTYAEYVRTAAGRVGRIGPRVSFEQAATVPTAAVTALEGIDYIGDVKAGQLVLVHSGAGGVGAFARAGSGETLEGTGAALRPAPPHLERAQEIDQILLILGFHGVEFADDLPRFAPEAVVLFDRLHQIARPAVMQEEDALSNSPKGSGAEFVRTRRSLRDAVGELLSHMVYEQVGKEIRLLI